MRMTCLWTALLLSAVAGQVSALEPNQPGSCVLPGGTAGTLKLALAVANAQQGLGLNFAQLSIDSIVLRSAARANGGFPLAGGRGDTGPIVCTFNRLNISPQVPYAPIATSAAADIDNIILRASQIETWIQYNRGSPARAENLICLSTGANQKCFRLVPQ